MIDRQQIINIVAPMIRPLFRGLENILLRATISMTDDSNKTQNLQAEILADEIIDDIENFQGYGFKSVPLEGCEAVIIAIGGDRENPLIIQTNDPRHRPKGWKAGDVGIYDHRGNVIRLSDSGVTVDSDNATINGDNATINSSTTDIKSSMTTIGGTLAIDSPVLALLLATALTSFVTAQGVPTAFNAATIQLASELAASLTAGTLSATKMKTI